jgi:hypothetical protein
MAAGELALFRLRNSGVLFSFGTRGFEDPFGKYSEERGFEPDVRLEARGEEALAQARLLARLPSP